MTKMTYTCLFLLAGWCAYAQSATPQVLANAGGSGETANYQVDWTLGELAITTLDGSAGALTQGFHQPNLIIVGTYDGQPQIAMEVFPNPTQEKIILRSGHDGPLDLLIYDTRGAFKLASVINKGDNAIQLDNMAAGHYFLTIHENGTLIKTFTIEKTGI